MAKWDIDKALRALEASMIPGTSIIRVTLGGAELMQRELGELTDEERQNDFANVWSLGLGRLNERHRFIYARTIREAYLRARRILKEMSPEEKAFFGVQAPKKPGPKAVRRRAS
jgi:hypothetical protein